MAALYRFPALIKLRGSAGEVSGTFNKSLLENTDCCPVSGAKLLPSKALGLKREIHKTTTLNAIVSDKKKSE